MNERQLAGKQGCVYDKEPALHVETRGAVLDKNQSTRLDPGVEIQLLYVTLDFGDQMHGKTPANMLVKW